MRGFDDRWEDFPDYILGVTEAVWEGRGVGAAMKTYFNRDVVLRTPDGVTKGEATATRQAMAALHAFPDQVLLSEDVIWSGTPADGMLASQRILSRATHGGTGSFGAPSGRRLSWRTMVDGFARENRISDQWIIRDTGAIVRQLGQTPQEWAHAEQEAGRAISPLTPESDIAGAYGGRGNDNAFGRQLSDLIERLMAADFSAVEQAYDRACHLEYPGGLSGHGHADADRFWLPLRAALPDATLTIHHVIGREDAQMPPRAAVRWSLWGRHSGWGAFGAPSHAKVCVMGITHAEFGPRGIRREWTLFDETAVWMQILSGTV